MQEIQLVLPEQLQSDIESIKSELLSLKIILQTSPPLEYLTRHEVSEKLGCSLSTVHNLTVKKVLTKFQIGGKVLYREKDVDNAIVKLK